jgi:hypothetical protein
MRLNVGGAYFSVVRRIQFSGTLLTDSGTAEQAGEKLVLAAESQPPALKRGRF